MLKATTILKERYELQSEPGNGGTGGILFAFDQVLGGKTVVVREMPVYLTRPNARAEELRRFYEEARQLASLDHPNLVSVNDYFEQGDRAYLIMEFVDGQNLAAAWSGRDLSMQEAANWVLQIGDALEYLHAQRPPVAFRVLEPDNVTVDPSGRVRLIHFDIAHTLGTGQLINKPGRGAGAAEFVSPEQRGGAGGDERSDIYSLGAIMYTMFTGKRPPASLDLASKNASLPRPRDVYPTLPAALESIILTAMAVNKGDRYRTVRDLCEELSRVPRAQLQGPTGGTAGRGAPGRPPAFVFASQPEVRPGARGVGREMPPRPVASRPSTVFFDASVKEEIDQPGELVDQGPRKAVVATVVVGVGLAAGLCWRSWQPAAQPPAGGQGPLTAPVAGSSTAPTSPEPGVGSVARGGSTQTVIFVDYSPPDARVRVDGKLVTGRSPLKVSVTPGNHEVQVEKEGYVTINRTARRLAKGDNKSYVAHLQPESKASQQIPPVQPRVPVGRTEPPPQRRELPPAPTTQRGQERSETQEPLSPSPSRSSVQATKAPGGVDEKQKQDERTIESHPSLSPKPTTAPAGSVLDAKVDTRNPQDTRH